MLSKGCMKTKGLIYLTFWSPVFSFDLSLESDAMTAVDCPLSNCTRKWLNYTPSLMANSLPPLLGKKNSFQVRRQSYVALVKVKVNQEREKHVWMQKSMNIFLKKHMLNDEETSPSDFCHLCHLLRYQF